MHQVMIPSRVRHPCVMTVDAVFADRVHAYVNQRLLGCGVCCARRRHDNDGRWLDDGPDTLKCHGAAKEAWRDGWQSLHPHTLCR